MRDLLERYIRSLREQDRPREAPEYTQDLGTFVYWLLERHGYRILERTFRYEDAKRIKATGERQWGADILATKSDPDGALRGCRFVLKRGPIGNTQWRHDDGFLPHDMWLAAERLHDDFERRLIGETIERWSVIAVHNGDFRIDQVGDQRTTLIERIRARTSIDTVEWWDAARLVDLVMLPPAGDSAGREQGADPSLFPPGIRPFARLAIDSLARGSDGASFDLDAVTKLVDAVLPVGVIVDLPRWQRAVSELGLFAAMIDVECIRRAEVRRSTLPGLETAERVLCRAFYHLASARELDSYPTRPVQDLITLLLRDYVTVAHRLVEHLTPVLTLERGLALASPSERIDYPLRTLRLAGYLAVAGAAALDLDDAATASMFGDRLTELFEHNQGGALTPVIDDQIVELSLSWLLWMRLDRGDVVQRTARALVHRHLLRRDLGLPMPGLWLEASIPLRERAVQILVDSQFQTSLPRLEDGGSLLLPLAFHLGWGVWPSDDAERREADQLARALAPSRPSRARDVAAGRDPDELKPKTIHLQSWLPPDDASAFWYSQSLARRGTSHVFRLEGSWSDLDREFRRFNRPLKMRSIASVLGFESVDWMAWKQFRNPPPMALLIEHPRASRESSE